MADRPSHPYNSPPQPMDTTDDYDSSRPPSSLASTVPPAYRANDEDSSMKAIMATLSNAQKSVSNSKMKSADTSEDDDDDDDDDIPMASVVAAHGGEETATSVASNKNVPVVAMATIVNSNDSKHHKSNNNDDDDDVNMDPSISLNHSSPTKSTSSATTSTTNNRSSSKKKKPRKRAKRSDAGVPRPHRQGKNPCEKGGRYDHHLHHPSTTSRSKRNTHISASKSAAQAHRSAAAAHRNRQIYIPPIGSPGLLMVPTFQNTANFPPLSSSSSSGADDEKLTKTEEEEALRTKYLVRIPTPLGYYNEYILPSTVFTTTMISSGYTLSKRQTHHDTGYIPHRGSSTERTVHDMFDSYVNEGLYIHFPELIPRAVWDRRLGDNYDKYVEVAPMTFDSPANNRGGGGGGGMKRQNSSSTLLSDIKALNAETLKRKDGPKGARSSYIFFTNAQRKLMSTQFPGMRFTEQGVIMGERWRALTPEEKKPYEEMAMRDKERYNREMAEYVKSVKLEMGGEEKKKDEGGEGGGDEKVVEEEGKKKDGSPMKQEEKSSKEEDEKQDTSIVVKDEPAEKQQQSSPPKKIVNCPKKVKGPRLVDAMILSLSKMLGEEVHRKEELNPPEEEEEVGEEPEPVPSSSSTETIKPETAATDSSTKMPPPPPTETVESGVQATDDDAGSSSQIQDSPRRVSPDLTVDELPIFTPASSQPQTRPHSHPPRTFLDMIPISLTASYPPSYVAKRRAYATAVKARERAIIEAQEAKDDADDAQEKYNDRIEAWERMLEYQKVQIAKRVEERKRRKEKEAAEKKKTNGEGNKEGTTSEENGNETTVKNDEGDDKKQTDGGGGGEEKKHEDATMKGGEQKDDNASENKMDGSNTASAPPPPPTRAQSPPPEDPLECMPPRPQPPGPARVVTIPDIPTPPSPPPVVEVEHMSDDDNDEKTELAVKSEEEDDIKVVPMRVPKVNPKLLTHLDPACFLPNLTGRYLGLLSNHISDPQFNGVCAPGIAGTTYGGGTGLATSYAGGGRGATGLVSGPSTSKGVANLWQNQSEKSERRRSLSPKPPKVAVPDDATSSSQVEQAIPSDPTASVTKDESSFSSSPAAQTPASSSKKRPPASSDASSSSSPSSEQKRKKVKRPTVLGLAVGDRNTTATEIASGSAGTEFPDGWIVKTYRRNGGETVGKTDRFWFSPGKNIRFRAKKHAVRFVEVLKEPEVDGDEEKAAELFRKRGLHF